MNNIIFIFIIIILIININCITIKVDDDSIAEFEEGTVYNTIELNDDVLSKILMENYKKGKVIRLFFDNYPDVGKFLGFNIKELQFLIRPHKHELSALDRTIKGEIIQQPKDTSRVPAKGYYKNHKTVVLGGPRDQPLYHYIENVRHWKYAMRKKFHDKIVVKLVRFDIKKLKLKAKYKKKQGDVEFIENSVFNKIRNGKINDKSTNGKINENSGLVLNKGKTIDKRMNFIENKVSTNQKSDFRGYFKENWWIAVSPEITFIPELSGTFGIEEFDIALGWGGELTKMDFKVKCAASLGYQLKVKSKVGVHYGKPTKRKDLGAGKQRLISAFANAADRVEEKMSAWKIPLPMITFVVGVVPVMIQPSLRLENIFSTGFFGEFEVKQGMNVQFEFNGWTHYDPENEGSAGSDLDLKFKNYPATAKALSAEVYVQSEPRIVLAIELYKIPGLGPQFTVGILVKLALAYKVEDPNHFHIDLSTSVISRAIIDLRPTGVPFFWQMTMFGPYKIDSLCFHWRNCLPWRQDQCAKEGAPEQPQISSTPVSETKQKTTVKIKAEEDPDWSHAPTFNMKIWPDIDEHSTNDVVEAAQHILLSAIMYADYENKELQVTGKLDGKTIRAAKQFVKKVGISMEFDNKIPKELLVFMCDELKLFKWSSHSHAVQAAQLLIKGQAHEFSDYGNLEVDGRFGDVTVEAVKELQQHGKLEPDGIVGLKTWGYLFAKNTRPVVG